MFAQAFRLWAGGLHGVTPPNTLMMNADGSGADAGPSGVQRGAAASVNATVALAAPDLTQRPSLIVTYNSAV
jgi:hypothetical protein